MHEYRAFVQAELDSRGWKQADLVKASGLSRQLISTILNDHRDHLGQMPDDATIEGLARGFSIPADRVRTAAARALAGYVDDGSPLSMDLREISIDALLNEVRRRVVGGGGGGVGIGDQSQHSREVAPDWFPAGQNGAVGGHEDGDKRYKHGSR